MRVISKKTLKEYWGTHRDVEQSLLSWYQTAVKAEWDSFEDVRNDLPSARAIGQARVIFKIKGNHYRLIVAVNYRKKIVWIRFIGTHAMYDKIDAKTI